MFLHFFCHIQAPQKVREIQIFENLNLTIAFLLLFFQEIIRPDVPWSPARAHGGHCQCYLVHVPTSQPCQHQLRFGVQMPQCLQGVCQR